MINHPLNNTYSSQRKKISSQQKPIKLPSKNYHFYYTDSIGKKWTIKYILHEYLNVMVLIFDRGYEDWGDCKGRAWCGTCHIFTVESLEEEMEAEEKHTLGHLPNKTESSRLACQIPLDEALHEKQVSFLGDFKHLVGAKNQKTII